MVNTSRIRADADGKTIVLLKAADRVTVKNLTQSHTSNELAHESLMHAWMTCLNDWGDFDISKLDLKYQVKRDPIVITDGKLETVPDAKVCAVLMLSDPNDYRGGEHNGAKLLQGEALFYQPKDRMDFAPVTEGVCKAYYFVLK